MANIRKFIESIKSIFGVSQKQDNTYQLNELHHGAVMQPTANNSADLVAAASGGVVTAQSAISMRVDHQGNGVTRTQANGVEIAVGRVVVHNDPLASATNMSYGEDDAAIELCHRPTTSSATPIVAAAAYYAGSDVEAQREATTNAHPTPPTFKSKAVAWFKSIFTSSTTLRVTNSTNSADNADTNVEAPAQAEVGEASNNAEEPSTFKARAMAWFQSITVCEAIVTIIGFVACFGTLYFGYYQKASYDLQRQTLGTNLVANFGA